MDTVRLAELFADPPAAYRPMIFWGWNGDITPTGIEEQVADFAAKGCGGFFIHSMGENFRLCDFVRGMTPPYLSDEYFGLIRHAVETAQRYDLYAWLYDEGGWPSGTAQGHVVEGHPELKGKRLHARRVRTLDLPALPENTVAALGLPDIGVPEPVDLRELAEGLWPYENLILFTVAPDGYPVDVLNPEAVRRFITVTHERYAECVGEFFGNTIPGIFTDETSLGGRLGASAAPWFGGILEILADQTGRDFRTYLPLLFSRDCVGTDVFGRYSDHEIVAARCEYYDLLTRRFGESYWQQITDWCTAHGLIHTGHVGGEDNLPDNLSFGHFFRTAGVLPIPGVDVIWRQLFPGQRVFAFPRLASSAMKQASAREGCSGPEDSAGEAARATDLPDPWAGSVLTESNAVYGFGLHYGQMRWLLDVQAHCGVNFYAPMAVQYTTSDGRLFGTMSHSGHGNPLWPTYRAFAEYVGRLCMLTRHGREQAHVAVYYPVEALWTIDGTDEAWESLQHVCAVLSAHHVPFDFIDADLLTSLTTDVGCGCAGEVRYETFIIPSVVALPAAVLGKLAELREAAATVLVLDHWPLQPSEMSGLTAHDGALQRLQQAGVKPTPADKLAHALPAAPPADFEVLQPHPELMVSSRTIGADHVYLLTNNSPRTIEPLLALDLAGPGSLEAWDLRDGEIIPLPWKVDLHGQAVQPVLPPWATVMLVLHPLPDDATVEEAEWSEDALALERWLSDPFHRPHALPPADVVAEFEAADRAEVVRQYLIEDGDVRLAEPDEFPTVYEGEPAPLWDWADWPMPDFAGEVRYEFELVVADELTYRPLLLDLGQVFWTARVELNGQDLGDLVWAPYVLDVSGLVKPGGNRLAITVANTLANQACRPEVEAEARGRGWCNAYVERTLPMMREDLRSGLVGPVRLLVAVPRVG